MKLLSIRQRWHGRVC